MSLNMPANNNEQYLLALRMYVERLFGADLKSVVMSGVDYRGSASGKKYKIDILRFQHHFQIPMPIKTLPFLDLFIDPETKNPRLTLCGEHTFSSELDESVPFDQIEHLFVSLIYGAQTTRKGVKAEVSPCLIQ